MFLPCGILASLLYIGIDILAGTSWQGYSFISQSISDLTSTGAPTRSLVVSLYLVYAALMITFGWGVWQLGKQKSTMRIVGCLIIGNAILNSVVSLFFPLHRGEPMCTPANLMNVIPMAIGMFCFLGAMGFGAASFRNWFRFYSSGILFLYFVLSFVGVVLPSRIPAWQRSPTTGIQERTMVIFYLSWVIALAINIWKMERENGTNRAFSDFLSFSL